METKYENWIKNLSYNELTEAQRNEISTFCKDEETFLQLKYVYSNLDHLHFSDYEVNDKVKEDLNHLFNENFAAHRQVWLNKVWFTLNPKEKALYKRPVFQLAAASVLVIAYLSIFNQPMKANNDLIAKKTIKEEKLEENLTQVPKEKAPLIAKLEQVNPVSDKDDQFPQEGKFAEMERMDEAPIKTSEDQGMMAGYTISKAEDVNAPNLLEETIVAHPDGIYKDLAPVKFEYTMDEIPEMLDLLAAAF